MRTMRLIFFMLCAALLAATEAGRRGRGRGRGNKSCRYNKAKWTECENSFQTKTRTLKSNRSSNDCKPEIISMRTCPWRGNCGCKYIPGDTFSECDPATDMQTLSWTVKNPVDRVTCPPHVQMVTCSDGLNERLQNRQTRREERQKKRQEKKEARKEKRKRAREERRERRKNRRRG